MEKKEIESISPASAQEWKKWLKKNHEIKQSVWLICHKKSSGKPSLSWSDAVDEALCFGWIDSIRKTIDEDSFMQFFGKRKPNSGWSKINKEKILRLTEQGLMAEAGLKCIETAKQNGSWAILDEVEELTVPKDLTKAFKANPGSKKFFEGLSRSVKKMMLQWVTLAKRPETREKRINEIAELAAKGMKPKHIN